MRTGASRTIVIALALICFASPIVADTGDWEWVYPPTGLEWYYGVDVFDANKIAIVGTSNTRLVSTDGGATWNRQFFGLSYGPLYDVQWLDATTLIACGAFGLVLKSTDAGATWNPIGNIPPAQLLGLQFTSATTGYACASNGSVYKTTNGGAAWTPQPVSGAALRDIAFVDDDHGWTVDEAGHIYRTANGGGTWDLVDTLPFELRGVGLWDFDSAVVVGTDKTVYTTTNGGEDWSTATLDQVGSELRVTSVEITGASTALLTTETPFGPVMEERGEVFGTNNQGQTWTRESIELQFLHAVRVRDGLGYAVGKYGRITRSTNGGDTWQDVTPPIHAELRTVDFPTADHGIVMHVLEAQLSYPYTWQWITDDGGGSFQRELFNDTPTDVIDVSAVDENVVYAVTYGPARLDVTAGVYKSMDGGETWSTVASGTCPPPGGGPCTLPFRFTAIDMVADGTGFACTNTGRVYRFSAADDTASVDVTGGAPLNDVVALNATSGVAVGNGGLIVRTTNGVDWLPVASGAADDLNAVAFSPLSSVGLVVGDNGTILRSIDGGESWDPIPAGGAASLADVVFLGEQVAVVSSEGGVAFISDDGGLTWDQEQVSVQLNDVRALAATDGGVYALVAGRGIAYRGVENPVATLFQQFEARVDGGSVALEWHVFTTDVLNGFTVYRDGTPAHAGLLSPAATRFDDRSVAPGAHTYMIVATDAGGVVARSPERTVVVRGYETALGQNHPNPFNPTTEIPFVLARGGEVEVTIHDVGGRLVATAMRRSLPAGQHKARWDGRNHHGDSVSSGVYFYRLRVVGRTLTRKMVLLK